MNNDANALLNRHAYRAGDRVRATNDGDGARGKCGVVIRVYRSGRMRVEFDDMSVRILRHDQIERVE